MKIRDVFTHKDAKNIGAVGGTVAILHQLIYQPCRKTSSFRTRI